MAKNPKPKTVKKSEDQSDPTVPSAPPVFDVSKPGESAPHPNSKPIIVGHKPMIKNDPMMAEEDSKDESSEAPAKQLKPKREAVIEPPAAVEKEIKPSEEADDNQAAEKLAQPEVSTGIEDEKDNLQNTDRTDSITSPAVEALADEAGKTQQQKQESEAAKKRQEEINKLITGGKYKLPIHDTVYGGSSHFNLFVNFLLIILLIAVGIVLAIDAGWLNLPIDLPFDLIK